MSLRWPLSIVSSEGTLKQTLSEIMLVQQSLNLGGGVVFIPLAFGLAVGLGYVIISAARQKRKKNTAAI